MAGDGALTPADERIPSDDAPAPDLVVDRESVTVLAHQYQAIATRRNMFDQLMWQMPGIALATGAILLNLIWGAGLATTPWQVRSMAGIAIALLGGFFAMVVLRTRRGEITDAIWLEAADSLGRPRTLKEEDLQKALADFEAPMFGKEWAKRRKHQPAGLSRTSAALWLVVVMVMVAVTGVASAVMAFSVPGESVKHDPAATTSPSPSITSPAPTNSGTPTTGPSGTSGPSPTAVSGSPSP